MCIYLSIYLLSAQKAPLHQKFFFGANKKCLHFFLPRGATVGTFGILFFSSQEARATQTGYLKPGLDALPSSNGPFFHAEAQ